MFPNATACHCESPGTWSDGWWNRNGLGRFSGAKRRIITTPGTLVMCKSYRRLLRIPGWGFQPLMFRSSAFCCQNAMLFRVQPTRLPRAAEPLKTSVPCFNGIADTSILCARSIAAGEEHIEGADEKAHGEGFAIGRPSFHVLEAKSTYWSIGGTCQSEYTKRSDLFIVFGAGP